MRPVPTWATSSGTRRSITVAISSRQHGVDVGSESCGARHRCGRCAPRRTTRTVGRRVAAEVAEVAQSFEVDTRVTLSPLPPWVSVCARNREWSTRMKMPSASAHSRSPAWIVPIVRTLRPSTRCTFAKNVRSVFSGVGLRYLIVSVPVIAPTPAEMLATPRSSSNSAAITPPCTHPGGPSYAASRLPVPWTAPSITSTATGGASAL